MVVLKNEKSLKLLNFNDLLRKIEINLLNDLRTFGLISDYQINLKNTDVRKILYHHVIYGICEEIKNISGSHKIVLLVPEDFSNDHELFQFCIKEDFMGVIDTLFSKIINIFPFVVYKTSMDLFNSSSDDGEVSEILNILYQIIQTKENKSFSFEKVKRLSDKFDLKFLSRDYFNDISIKSRLYTK